MKEVIVHISGGVATVAYKDRGIVVHVLDFDVDDDSPLCDCLDADRYGQHVHDMIPQAEALR